jgi:hypothetical protein
MGFVIAENIHGTAQGRKEEMVPKLEWLVNHLRIKLPCKP